MNLQLFSIQIVFRTELPVVPILMIIFDRILALFSRKPNQKHFILRQHQFNGFRVEIESHDFYQLDDFLQKHQFVAFVWPVKSHAC